MSIMLSSNERIIRDYAYATTTEGMLNKRTTNHSLVITNKRIIKKEICDKTGYESIHLSEIPVNAVTGVDVKMSSGFKFFFLILGIIVGLAGIMTMIGGGEAGTVILGILLLGIAALCIYAFIKKRDNALVCTFTVSDRITPAMFLGQASVNTMFSRFRISLRSNLVKIVVDANVAKDFVNEIGALLAEIKENPVA